jgi:cadmium resistance protein CadD (predicted permease)
MFELFCIAIALFISTNIDDMFLLLGFFANVKFRAREVIVGQSLGIALLIGVSILASLLSFSIPRPYIGLLGIVVIALGLKKLIALFTEPAENHDVELEEIAESAHNRILAVTIVTMANGGDNIAIYTPAFAIHSRKEVAVIVLIFAVLTAIWCLVAYSIVNHSGLRTSFQRYGQMASYVVLIAVGTMVMIEAHTFELVHRFAR